MNIIKILWGEFTDSKQVKAAMYSLMVNSIIVMCFMYWAGIFELFVGEYDQLWLKVFIFAMFTGAVEVFYTLSRFLALCFSKVHNLSLK